MQLGSGLNTSYPGAIDTYQTFVNGTPMAPDANTRVDSELMMDILRAIIAIETTLGANPQGGFGSVAARLNAFLPLATQSNIISFLNASVLSIPGTSHDVTGPGILTEVYDTSAPMMSIQPQTVSVDYTTSNDVVVTFGVNQSGTLAIAAPTPLYAAPFTTISEASPLVVPATTHGLGAFPYLYAVYDAADPAVKIDTGGFTAHAATGVCTLTFAFAQSGLLVLSSGGAGRYVTTFTNVSDAAPLVIPGTVHGIPSPYLLYQAYDDAAPSANAIPCGSFRVDATTRDVIVTFAVAQSGTLLLAPVPAPAMSLAALTAPSPVAPLPRRRRVTTESLGHAVLLMLERLESVEAQMSTLHARLPEEASA